MDRELRAGSIYRHIVKFGRWGNGHLHVLSLDMVYTCTIVHAWYCAINVQWIWWYNYINALMALYTLANVHVISTSTAIP